MCPNEESEKNKKVSFRIFNLFLEISLLKIKLWGFPGGAVVKNPPANAGDTGSTLGPGRSYMLRSN